MTTRRTKRATPRQPRPGRRRSRPRPCRPSPRSKRSAPRRTSRLRNRPRSRARDARRASRHAAPDADQPRRSRAGAEQIFANVDLDAEDDKFALPSNLAPDGWEYEWKTYEVIGKRNPGNEVQQARIGSEPVDPARHPEMMPNGYGAIAARA